MDASLYEQPVTPEALERLARAGHLSGAGLERAYTLTGKTATLPVWKHFINWMLLALGTTLSLAGAFFLVAYNWAEIPHLVKIELVVALLLAMVALASFYGIDSVVGRVMLLASAVLVGALFAVFGQVYQTGADSFQLFLTWAILIIPWVFISKWTPLWLLLLTLVNLSLGFFWVQRLPYEFTALCITLALVNTVWLCIWEYGNLVEVPWMQQRWFPQLIGTGIFGLLLVPTLLYIIDTFSRNNSVNLLGTGVYALFCLLVTTYYNRRRDLFLLSVCALSLVIVATVASLRFFQRLDFTSSLLLNSFIVVVTTSIAVALLRRTARSWEGTTS